MRELGVEDLQVLLNEDFLALPGQSFLRGFVEVDGHATSLLQKTSFRLRAGRARKGVNPTSSWAIQGQVRGFLSSPSAISLNFWRFRSGETGLANQTTKKVQMTRKETHHVKRKKKLTSILERVSVRPSYISFSYYHYFKFIFP